MFLNGFAVNEIELNAQSEINWIQTDNQTIESLETEFDFAIVNRVFNETLEISELVIRLRPLAIIIDEVLNITTASLGVTGIAQVVDDGSLALNEFLIKRTVLNRIFNETESIIEAAEYVKLIIEVVAESISLSEISVIQKGHVFVVNENQQQSEVAVRFTDLNKIVSEEERLDVNHVKTLVATRIVNTVLQLPENIIQDSVLTRTFNETFQSSELTEWIKFFLQVVNETNSISETLAKFSVINRLVAEVEEELEGISLRWDIVRPFVEQESVSENIPVSKTLIKVFNGVVQASEISRRIIGIFSLLSARIKLSSIPTSRGDKDSG